METATEFFALLTVTANVFVIAVAGTWLLARRAPRVAARFAAARAWLQPAALPLAWAVAATATAGSLAYSEVAGFIPCKLCWYQRIGMYPLVVILAIAALRRDAGVRWYVLPLAGGGAMISIYHYLIQRFPAGAGFCDEAAPCTLTWVWKYHYISIPFMALSAFALIATLLLLARVPKGTDAAASRDRQMAGAIR